MVRLELTQLACVSLMPFSTALIGEHGNLPVAAVIYAGNMLAITLTGAWRTVELLHQPRVHVEALDGAVVRTLVEHAGDAADGAHPGACARVNAC